MNLSTYNLRSGLSLRANFSWTLVGNVVYAGCQWGMLIVLAKLGSPEMVGQFALGLAVTAPIMLFAGMRLRVVQATDARGEYRFGDYLGLRLITTAAALLVIAGFMLVSGYRQEVALVILVVGIAKAFESISDVFYGLLQQHDRMDRIAKSMIIKGSLSLVALGIGVYLTGSVFWGVIGLAVAWATILVGYDVRSGALILKSVPHACGTAPDGDSHKLVLRPRWDLKTLTRLAWLALPLGFVVMLGSLDSNIPRYFVEQNLGTRELGIFAALAFFHRSGIIVVNALGNSASPLMSRYFAAGDSSEFRTLLVKLTGFAVLLGGAGVLVAVIAGRRILTLFYGPEYAQQDVFVMLMIAAGMAYVASFLTYGMAAARYFRVQVVLHVIVIGVLILACTLLIPFGGLRGTATALIIARVVHVGGSLAIIAYILYALHSQIQRVKPAELD